MNMNSQKLRKYAQIFGVMCGGLLIGVPALSQTAVAQQPTSTTTRQSTPNVNPCPSIFYEEPHNNRVAVPQGCPPNAFSQQQQSQAGSFNQGVPVSPQGSINQSNQGNSVTSQTSIGRNTTATPTPSQVQAPSATIALNNGQVNINLVNDTAAIVTYQIIGDTAPRTLQGKSSVMLQGISAPVTVTFEREDGGLLIVSPQGSAEQAGMLQVRLNEATNVAQDTKAMRIQPNGSVFLN